MTKQDYIILTNVINDWITMASVDNKPVPADHALNLVDMLMQPLQDNNKRFDHKRFITECFKGTKVDKKAAAYWSNR